MLDGEWDACPRGFSGDEVPIESRVVSDQYAAGDEVCYLLANVSEHRSTPKSFAGQAMDVYRARVAAGIEERRPTRFEHAVRPNLKYRDLKDPVVRSAKT